MQLLRWCAILTIVSPLIIWTGLPYPSASARLLWLAGISIIAACALVAQHTAQHTRISIIESALLFFVATQILASLSNERVVDSFFGSLERATSVALLILAIPLYGALKKTYEHSRETVRITTLITLALMSVIAIAQAIFPQFLPTFSGGRVGGTLGNAVMLGTYLVLSILLVAHDMKKNNWDAWCVGALALVALVLTGARASLLALLIVGCGALVVVAVRQRASVRHVVATTVALLLLTGILIWCQAPRFAHLTGTQTVASRIVNWRIAWRGFLDRPLIGWGPHRYDAVVDAHFDPALNRFGETESFPDKPHNYYVELLATSGVVGTLGYLVVLCVVAITLKRRSLWILAGFFVARELQLFFLFESHGSFIPTLIALAMIAPHATEMRWTEWVGHRSARVALAVCVVVLAWMGVVRPILTLDAPFKSTGPFVFERWDALRERTLAQPATRAEFIEHTQELQKIFSTRSKWQFAIGVAHAQLFAATHEPSHATFAHNALTRADALTPNRLPIIVQQAQLLLATGRYAQARDMAHRAIMMNLQTTNAVWIAASSSLFEKDTLSMWNYLDILISQKFDFQKVPEPLFRAFIKALVDATFFEEANRLQQLR